MKERKIMKERKGNKLTEILNNWLVRMFLFCIPIVSLVTCGACAFAIPDRNTKRWGLSALIVSAVVHITVLIVWIRINNMTYPEFYSFVGKIFNK